MSEGDMQRTRSDDKENIFFSPNVLRDLLHAIDLKLESKNRKLKLDTLSAAMKRSTPVPFDVPHPPMDLGRVLKVFLKEPVQQPPAFYIISELAHRRAELSRLNAMALLACRRASMTSTPLTPATNAKFSSFLAKIDNHLDRLTARQAKATAELFADTHLSHLHVQELFKKFLLDLNADASNVFLTDEDYDATICTDTENRPYSTSPLCSGMKRNLYFPTGTPKKLKTNDAPRINASRHQPKPDQQAIVLMPSVKPDNTDDVLKSSSGENLQPLLSDIISAPVTNDPCLENASMPCSDMNSDLNVPIEMAKEVKPVHTPIVTASQRQPGPDQPTVALVPNEKTDTDDNMFERFSSDELRALLLSVANAPLL